MGNTQSGLSGQSPGKKSNTENKTKITLPGIIDTIATKFILTQDFEDLLKLDDIDYCNKLVILTSKIIGDRLNSIEIEYLNHRVKEGVEINMMDKDKIMYLKKDKLGKLDIQNSIKKKRVCIGIAKFYIKIAHLFASIVSVMAPEYEVSYPNSTKSRIPYMKKNLLSKEEKERAKLTKNGLCYRRIQSIITKQLEDTDMELKMNVCDLNKIKKSNTGITYSPTTATKTTSTIISPETKDITKQIPQISIFGEPKSLEKTSNEVSNAQTETTPLPTINPTTKINNLNPFIQYTGSPETQQSQAQIRETQFETQNIIGGNIVTSIDDTNNPTMTLVDERGIPELYKLYMDKFDYNTSKFVGITEETMKQYKADLLKFYVAFTGNKVMPPDIKKFSDIKLKDYHNNPSCQKETLLNRSYKLKNNSKTYKNYGKQLSIMMSNMNFKHDKLIELLNEVFVYRIDPITKNKEITLHPGLTYQRLDLLIKNAREIIVDLYVGCEMDYGSLLETFETVIEEQIRNNTNSKISNIKKEADQMLSEI